MNVSLTFFAVKKPLQKEYAFSHNGAKARFIICYELLLVILYHSSRNPKGS